MNSITTFVRGYMNRRRTRRNRSMPMEMDDFTEPSIEETSRIVRVRPHRRQGRRSTNHDEDDDHNEDDLVEDEVRSVSFLYSLATRWAWKAVIFRASTHPEEVVRMDRDMAGDTVLHWSCFGVAPIEVIHILLEKCPTLSRQRNSIGHLPIHVACSYRCSSDVIRRLVEIYPESCKAPNGSGSYCLHILCDYGCTVESIQAIVETQEGVESVTKVDGIYQRTPLFILQERQNMVLYRRSVDELRRVRQRQSEIIHDGSTGDNDEVSIQNNWQELEASIEHLYTWDYWEKAKRLIVAQHLQKPLVTEDDLQMSGIIHACLLMKETCPPSLLEFVILLNTSDWLYRNEQGQVPLHLACHMAQPSIVSEVLSVCPKAATISDKNGNLPLSIFLQQHPSSGWDGTLHDLIVANPMAVNALELDSKLYPYIWSRMTNRTCPTTGKVDCSVLYDLIRGNPSIFGQ